VTQLPALDSLNFSSTRNYLQNIAKVIGKLQRLILVPEKHEWQQGLEVVEGGMRTQPMLIDGQEFRILFDINGGCVRVGEVSWPLENYDAPEMLANLKIWLAARKVEAMLEAPSYITGDIHYDDAQAKSYVTALDWMNVQFELLKSELHEGFTSPILLYPHHFDVSLSWFHRNNDDQLSVGFSTGDETVAEAYVYLTMYPESPQFKDLRLPEGAYWQKNGFSGDVLPYSVLQNSTDPATLFSVFSKQTMTAARQQIS
jgi:hypothetical protein